MSTQKYVQLPDEKPIQASKKNLVRILTMIVLSLTLLNVASYLFIESFTTNSAELLLRKKWELVTVRPVDWLILGDSSAAAAVLPEIVKEHLGGESVNLATVGNWGLIQDAWLLETYIQQWGAPKGIILVHVYDIYSRSPEANVLAQAPLPWNFWQQFVIKFDLAVEQQIDLFVQKYLPLYSRHETLLANIQQKIAPRDHRYSVSEDGVLLITYAAPDDVEKDLAEHVAFVSENQFNVTSVNQQAMDYIVRIADQYKIDIYIAHSPLYEKFFAEPYFQTYFEQLDAWLRTVDAESPYLHYLDSVLTFPNEQMESIDHLKVGNAERFSEHLMTLIETSRTQE